jgi:hypothetical protein
MAFREHFNVDTSGWLGPYNIIMARTDGPQPKSSTKDGDGNLVRTVRDTFVSRYVETPSTAATVRRPMNCSILPPALFDSVAGASAVRNTIRRQGHVTLKHGEDPYGAFSHGCDHGDVEAILPLFAITVETATTVQAGDGAVLNRTAGLAGLMVQYDILDLPDPTTEKALYRIWPTMQQHLGPTLPIAGPYCFGKDPHRGHAVRVSYDSTNATTNQTWRVVKDGCLEGVPCWNGNGGTSIPYDNGASAVHVVDPTGLAMLLCYGMGFLLVVSLVFNYQLSHQLKRLQLQHHHDPATETAAAAPPSSLQQQRPQQPQQQPAAPPPAAFLGRQRRGGTPSTRTAPPSLDGNLVADDLEQPLLAAAGGPVGDGAGE